MLSNELQHVKFPIGFSDALLCDSRSFLVLGFPQFPVPYPDLRSASSPPSTSGQGQGPALKF